ncbi:unnamed protein product [Prunus brigantina]
MPLLLRQAYYATCPYLANHHRRPIAAGHLSTPQPATTVRGHHCQTPTAGHLPSPPPVAGLPPSVGHQFRCPLFTFKKKILCH